MTYSINSVVRDLQAEMSYYAVAIGRQPGVYRSWPEMKKQVDGFKNPKFRKFATEDEAEEFVKTAAKPKSIVDQLDAETETTVVMPSEGSLVVFTDGSSVHNGKKNAKAGYAMVWPYHPHLSMSSKLEGDLQTNNRAEFTACIKAIEAADVEDPSRKKPLHIYTDSMLLINTVTKWTKGWKKNGWKKADGNPVMNKDLVVMLDELTSTTPRKIVWTHVEAHTNNKDWASEWNAKVDEMARSTTTAD